MKMKQKDAVYATITNVLAERGVRFEDGMDISEHVTKDVRAQVNAILLAGFKAGQIELDKEYDDVKLRSYTSGLVSNWLRKDKRLNGGTKYQAKNPGTRVGASDQQLRALKALRAKLAAEGKDTSEVDGYIEARVAELNAAKMPTVDYDALPDALKKYA